MIGNIVHKIQDEFGRKFLVVVDETGECDRAVTFAAYRAWRTGGTLVLLAVIEPGDFQHWLGVESIMRAEATQEAAQLLEQRAARIASIGPIRVDKVIREGPKADEVEAQIAEDESIAILVLAAGTSSEGPGPLVTAFATRSSNALPIPVTIVPGGLSDEQIIAIC